jgi:hypothetical protein
MAKTPGISIGSFVLPSGIRADEDYENKHSPAVQTTDIVSRLPMRPVIPRNPTPARPIPSTGMGPRNWLGPGHAKRGIPPKP